MSGIDNEGLRQMPLGGFVAGGRPVLFEREGREAIIARPAVKGIRRVFVGGPLHGIVALVPESSTSVIAMAPGCDLDELARNLVDVPGDDHDRAWFAVAGLTQYHARQNGQTQLMIEVELIRSGDRVGKASKLSESIVNALGLAAGVHGPGGPLVVSIPVREPETD